jgi:hypothetical protein
LPADDVAFVVIKALPVEADIESKPVANHFLTAS